MKYLRYLRDIGGLSLQQFTRRGNARREGGEDAQSSIAYSGMYDDGPRGRWPRRRCKAPPPLPTLEVRAPPQAPLPEGNRQAGGAASGYGHYPKRQRGRWHVARPYADS